MLKAPRRLFTVASFAVMLAATAPAAPVLADEGRQDEQRLRTTLRRALEHALPQQAAAVASQYGMTAHTSAGSEPVRDQELPSSVVVLLHGLDDGGGQWNQLIPRLREAKVTAIEINYPNDQPLVESSRTLAGHLRTLRRMGALRVDIVTHSMGALVARDVLTGAAHYNGNAAGGRHLPHVSRLIMIAPPNQGSECARFDAVSELREQTMRWFDDRAINWGCIFDGLGEARLDLLPGSAFLTDLNARAAPRHCAMTIVAGRVCGRTVKTIDRISGWARRVLPDHGEAIEIAAGEARDMTGDLGDGVVPIKSARLKGVDDFVVVDATHVDIVANVRSKSTRVPPAVSIILDRLNINP